MQPEEDEVTQEHIGVDTIVCAVGQDGFQCCDISVYVGQQCDAHGCLLESTISALVLQHNINNERDPYPRIRGGPRMIRLLCRPKNDDMLVIL